MLIAVNLDEHAVALGDAFDPLAFVHCTVSLEHPTAAMALIILEFAFVFDACRPTDLGYARKLSLVDVALVDGLNGLLRLAKECDRSPTHLALFCYRDLPATAAVFAALDEVSNKDAAVVADQLSVAFRMPIAEVSNETASVFVGLDTRAMLETVIEKAFINVAHLGLEDAVAPGLVVRPHARVMEL